MRIRTNSSGLFVANLLMLLGVGQTSRAAWILIPQSHLSIAELGDGWSGALDAGLSVGYLPIEEIALGLDTALILPLEIAKVNQQSSLAFDLYPMIWLRFGQESSWFYLKIGTGVTCHVTDDQLTPIWSLAAGAGVVVQTRDFPFFWGFEVTSRFGLSSEISTRTVGLGALLGWRL